MSSIRPAQSGWTSNLETLSSLPELNADVLAVLAEFSAAAGYQRVAPWTDHGGLSGAQLWRVEAGNSAFALRQWPAEHPSPERLRFIHAVLAHAHQYGAAIVPVPLEVKSGETFVERKSRLWELASWLPGETNFERELTQAKIISAMRSLAKFHLASFSFSRAEKPPSFSDVDFSQPPGTSFGETRPRGPSTGLVERAGRFAELNDAHLALFRDAVRANRLRGPHDAVAVQMLSNLPNAVESVRPLLMSAANFDLPLQPCLRDIWHGNVLFTGNEVTGIVDFGAIQIDSPALDVARLLGSMAGDDAEAWQDGIAAYEQLRLLPSNERTAVVAADASGTVLGCVNWLRWLYVERRQFRDLRTVEIRMNSLAERLRWLASGRIAGAIAFAGPRGVR